MTSTDTRDIIRVGSRKSEVNVETCIFLSVYFKERESMNLPYKV